MFKKKEGSQLQSFTRQDKDSLHKVASLKQRLRITCRVDDRKDSGVHKREAMAAKEVR